VKKMGYFCEMLSYVMRNNPNQNFVLRPHPTESLEFYRNAFHEFDNILISNEFSAVEWISRCSLLIQNGCTTSVEAYFLEKPVIDYYPFISSHGVDVTRGIGLFSKTPEEVDNLLKNIKYDQDIRANKEELCSVVSNFATNDSTMDLIAKVASSNIQSKNKNKIPLLNIKLILLKNFLTNTLKFYPRYFFKEKSKSYQMAVSHFPGFRKNEIDFKVKTLNKINKKRMDLNFVSKDLFILSAED